MGVHREAEFAKNHTPAYSRGVEPAEWLCVYPFVRSYEWYLLPDAERGAMLRDHGMLGREFPQVISNTVSSFALGDWEWILGLEAPRAGGPRGPDAPPARHRGPPPRPRRNPLLHRPPGHRRRDRRGPCMSPLDPQAGPGDRRQPRHRGRPDGAEGLRRRAARLLRRPRGPGRRHSVPPQRHPRPRHPRRAARRGLAPLPRQRRHQPDQPAEPRAQGRHRSRAGRPRHRPAGVLGQPQLGPLHPADPPGHLRRRAPQAC